MSSVDFWNNVVKTALEKLEDLEILARPDVHWIFRASPKKNLLSTFDRLCSRARINDSNKQRTLEVKIMREFMRAAHHYLDGPLPGRTDLAEWMSLGRHYGSPSRKALDVCHIRFRFPSVRNRIGQTSAEALQKLLEPGIRAQ